jgi:hypothetical protein
MKVLMPVRILLFSIPDMAEKQGGAMNMTGHMKQGEGMGKVAIKGMKGGGG